MSADLLIIFVRDFAIFVAIYIIVALSLNLEYGYTGVPNFGKVLAVAGGAFSVGFFPGRIVAWLFGLGTGTDYLSGNVMIVTEVNKILAGNPALSIAIFFITLILAGVVGAVLGFVTSYPAIRLREDYLAITLLAMGEAIQVIGYNFTPIIGGNIGVLVPDPFGWAGDLRYGVVAVVFVAICLLVFLFHERLIRSPLGRMLRAIRDNETVAESLGKDTTRIRMKVIIIASVIGALGGALHAFSGGAVSAKTYHRVSWTFWPWVIVILGGAANNFGVVVGTLAFTGLRRFIDYYKGALTPFLPFNVVWLDYLLLGIMLILIQMFRPEGILREKPTVTLGYERLKRFVGLEKQASQMEKESEEKLD